MASLVSIGNDLYTGARSINFIKRRKVFYLISALAVLAAIFAPMLRGGFQLGIEFTGGSEFTISGSDKYKDQGLAREAVQEVTGTEVEPLIATVGQSTVRIQTTQLDTNGTTARTDAVADALAKAYGVPNPGNAERGVSTSFIGPTWGADISGAAIRALVIFLVLVVIVMALYFRTWKMALAGLVALLHDLIITAGVYGIVGFEVTPAAVIGFLTILGYSLYDVVVVFDKIRENTSEMRPNGDRTFAETVNLAVNQTLVRSINTSIVGLLPIASILFIGTTFLGAGTLRDISLALFVGILVGTYSTIFIAAPLYTDLRKGEQKVSKETKRVLAQRNSSAKASA